jgi:hypothetical protein
MYAGVVRDRSIACADVLDEDTRMMANAYGAWHLLTSKHGRLRGPLAIADLAIAALAVPDAEDIALRALEEATATQSCAMRRRPKIQERVRRIADSLHAQAKHAERRARLAQPCPE